MPAHDTFHEALKRGLRKEGRTISDDPYTITYGGEPVGVPMPARRPIAANRGDHHIAVEIERFKGAWPLSDYHTGLGRFLNHRLAMLTDDPGRVLFLALPGDTYEQLFAISSVREGSREYRVPLIAHDPEENAPLRWLTQFAPESRPRQSSPNPDPRRSDADSPISP